ncbi:MAG: SUMF1/EgtB/PvdO family nonheme iron enzyme [Verrucomicrobiota bacterium]
MNACPQELLGCLDEADSRMVALIESLTDEQLDVPYERGINPPIWEMGHAAFFFEYFLLRALYGGEERMPGYDEIWDSFEIPHRERWSRGVVPEKTTSFDYYRRVIDETRSHLDRSKELSGKEIYLTKYCIAHQCMHLESLIWSRQTLAYPAPPFSQIAPTDLETCAEYGDAEVPGGDYFVGIPAHDQHATDATFSFDNERPGFSVRIEPFNISKTLVSNQEFAEFVDDDGYKNPDHWTFGGKYWLRQAEATHPIYWQKRDGAWWMRRFDQFEPLRPHAPALHLSFREAEAFCNWAGRRLPNEFEWEAAARGPEAHLFPWGNQVVDHQAWDLDARYLGTAPVTAFPQGASPFGCLQMLGTAWEWTTSQYLPFDGFEVDMYPYMSTLQFGDHKTTRGGGCATSSCLIRNTYRQAYYPDRNDVFIGFRTCAL